jgi:RNA polymerase sigma factor (TIGR02999 family)
MISAATDVRSAVLRRFLYQTTATFMEMDAEDGSPGGPPPGDVTTWLLSWSRGDEDALGHLMPVVYDELRRRAASCLRRERADHTLDAAALVHEAYLRLIDQRRARWKNRAHFFAIAARVMRRVLVDHARRRGYRKRGGEARLLTVEDLDQLPAGPSTDWLALDDALERLAAEDPEQGRIVELHVFGGLTHAEIAAVVGVSVPTVVRRWRMARAWLYRHLHGDPPGP